MGNLIKWFHHLFNPHCAVCKIESECLSCKVLETQLRFTNQEKEKLLDSLIGITRPVVIEQAVTNIDPVMPKRRAWGNVKAELERDSREKAKALENAGISDKSISAQIEDLEKEVGLEQ